MFNPRKKLFSFSCWLLFACSLQLFSCDTIDLYEKVLPLPAHQWQTNFRPRFTFQIKDTTVPYQAFIILRHNNKYSYNNLWVNLYTKSPDGTVGKAQYELPLATNEKGWLGIGMDDLYEHRIALTPVDQNFYFKKPGTYIFTLEHVMRQDTLEQVMNVGLRIEKKQ